MKTRTKIIASVLLLCSVAWMIPEKAPAQGGSVSFQVFYNELSPYGTWVVNPDYGYVWVPDVAPGFTPYSTNGYWVFTDEGWTWVSNYAWGWAPFHYGRWYNDQNWGPIWVPDNEWGPGWVTWRMSAGYYGWAPMGPGISISMTLGGGYDIPYNQWTFVRDRDFGRRNITNYYVNSNNNITIINNSTIINNTRVNKSRNVTYNAGPARAEVEKHSGKKFEPVVIQERNKPGQTMNQNNLQIYRPQVQKNVPNGQKPAPARVSDIKDVKSPAQRGSANHPPTTDPVEKHQPLPPQRTTEPLKQQPLQQQHQAQPVKQQPVPQKPPQQQQPQKQQPQKQQPQPRQPQKQQPQKQQPQKQQPQQQQPQRQQPQPQQPQKQQPQKQQPPQQQPQKQQPQKQQPQPQQPQKQQPPQKQDGVRPPH